MFCSIVNVHPNNSSGTNYFSLTSTIRLLLFTLGAVHAVFQSSENGDDKQQSDRISGSSGFYHPDYAGRSSHRDVFFRERIGLKSDCVVNMIAI